MPSANVVQLWLTDAARNQIERIYALSGLERDLHVPALIKSWPVELPSNIVQSISSQEVSAEEIAQQARILLSQGQPTGSHDWVVGLYELSRIDHKDIYSANGVELYLLPNVVFAVANCVLDFDREWVLRPNTPVHE